MTDIAISDRTIKVLKNFSVIHPSIIIEAGSCLYTSRERTLFAWTEVEEKFPIKFGFFALSEFIAILDKQKHPKLEFQENFVLIKSEHSRVRYLYTPEKILEKVFQTFPFPPGKLPPGCEYLTEIKWEDISKIKRISGTMTLDTIQVVCKGGRLILRGIQSKKPKENLIDIALGKIDSAMDDFVASVEVSKFILSDDTYKLYVVPGKALAFKGESFGVSYLITLDKELSKF